MVAYWLWTSWEIGSYFSVFEQVENLEVILLLIVGHGCFLDILLEPFFISKNLSVKIFSSLCSYFWGGNFEMHFLREQFWSVPTFWIFFLVFIHTLLAFIHACFFRFKKFLITDQFNMRLQASLAKWLSVCLRTKWLWVRVQLQPLHEATVLIKKSDHVIRKVIMWLLWSDVLCVCRIIENNIVNKFIK